MAKNKKATVAPAHPTFRARLKPDVGKHREGMGENAIDYKAGDIVESNLDLIKVFPGKFEDINAHGPAEEDVTGDFDAAGENGLRVIKRGGKWYLCGPGGTGDELTGALQKGKVEDAVYSYLETASEDNEDEDDENDDEDEDDENDDD